MDPKLVQAVRDMLVAQKRATAAGVSLSPADLEAFIREETGNKYGLAHAQKLLGSIDTGVNARNLGRSALQGATFDWGDELLGMLPEALGGGKDAENEMRLRQDLFRSQHPVADGAAGLAGGIATGLLIPGGEAATLGKTIGRGALIGAGVGAVAGAGRGEGSVGDRASGALVGAGTGAVLGAAIPAAVGSVKSLAPSAVAARRVSHAIEESGGADAVRAKVGDFDLANRGDHVMLGDLSDRLRAETDFAANNNDDVLSQLAPEVVARNREGSARLLKDTKDVLGETPRPGQRARALKATTQQVGRETFAELRAQNPQIDLDPATVSTLQDPVVSTALRDAQRTGMIGPNKDLGNPSFSHLQDVKESLDDAITKSFKAGDNNRALRLKEARDVVVKQLSKVAGYDEATLRYAVAKQNERALAAGLKAWNTEDTDELAHAMAQMSTDAAEQFRYGMASKLVLKLKNVATNRDAAKELMDASEAMQDKLKVVFGTKDNFNRFMARVAREADLQKMKNTFGNSATQRRAQAAGFDPLEMGVHLAEGAVHPTSLLKLLSNKTFGARTRATAGAVGQTMMTKGAGNIQSLLDTYTNPEPLLGRLTGTALPAAMGGLLKN